MLDDPACIYTVVVVSQTWRGHRRRGRRGRRLADAAATRGLLREQWHKRPHLGGRVGRRESARREHAVVCSLVRSRKELVFVDRVVCNTQVSSQVHEDKTSEMSETIHEGDAVLQIEANVFYNLKQVLQRDLTMLAIRHIAAESLTYTSSGRASTGATDSTGRRSAHAPSRGLRFLDALSGSGVRAIRACLEVTGLASVVANDADPEACNAIRRNACLSGLQPCVASKVQRLPRTDTRLLNEGVLGCGTGSSGAADRPGREGMPVGRRKEALGTARKLRRLERRGSEPVTGASSSAALETRLSTEVGAMNSMLDAAAAAAKASSSSAASSSSSSAAAASSLAERADGRETESFARVDGAATLH
eukprot:6212811-Pleurochrysis_carterae.AAC.5